MCPSHTRQYTHKSQNAFVPHPTMQHFGTEMCTCEHFCYKMVHCMMTSSNGNIFRVTGHLCGEFTRTGEFPAQRAVTRSFVFFDLRLNKRLSKQSWGWWFETLSHPLWRHCNDGIFICCIVGFVRWAYYSVWVWRYLRNAGNMWKYVILRTWYLTPKLEKWLICLIAFPPLSKLIVISQVVPICLHGNKSVLVQVKA